jgi:DNA-binding transcriptional regulator GbsR (MarR family)
MHRTERAILAELYIQPQTIGELFAGTEYSFQNVRQTVAALIDRKLVQKTSGVRGKNKQVIVYQPIEYCQKCSK